MSYQADLAYIHDVGFGWFAEQSGPGLLKLLCDDGINDGLIVDLGCGSGIWAKQLTEAGYDVLGVDFSADMIRIAKQTAPKARFRNASFIDFPIPECRCVTAIGEIFNYLFDSNNNADRRTETFQRIFDALQPGGLFIFDMIEPGYLRHFGNPHRHVIRDDWALLLDVEEDAVTNQLTRRMTTFRNVGKTYRRREEVHVLQLAPAAEIATQLRAIGFRTRIVRGYGKFRFRKAHAGFVARKPSR